MCWKIDSKKSGKNPDDYHKIAKENIAVFKFGWANKIDNVFQPYFMIDAEYKPNVRNEEIELKYNNFKKTDLYYIGKGYHSYSGDCIYAHQCVYPKDYVNGFCLEQYCNANFLGIFKIPKGTEYYENEDGEIVSSNIIWIGAYYDIELVNEEYIRIKDYALMQHMNLISF